MQSISFAIVMPSEQSRRACQSYDAPQRPITSKLRKPTSAGSRNHSSRFINLVIRFVSAHLLFKIHYDRNGQPGTHYVATKAIPRLVVRLNGVLQTLNMPPKEWLIIRIPPIPIPNIPSVDRLSPDPSQLPTTDSDPSPSINEGVEVDLDGMTDEGGKLIDKLDGLVLIQVQGPSWMRPMKMIRNGILKRARHE